MIVYVIVIVTVIVIVIVIMVTLYSGPMKDKTHSCVYIVIVLDHNSKVPLILRSLDVYVY